MKKSNNSNIFDYIIVGGGIVGCSVANLLNKHNKNIAIVEKLDDVAFGASGTAGAFLSPLLGKDNILKTLVSKSLNFSTKFYLNNFGDCIDNCGVLRVPKTKSDRDKFKTYEPYLDFRFNTQDDGYFFPIGSLVNSKKICKDLSCGIKKILNYEVKDIKYIDNIWILNDDIKTKNIIFSTGFNTSLIDEPYLGIRGVWGQRIDIKTSTILKHNYHKSCSISKTYTKNSNHIVSIGATHKRDDILDTAPNQGDTLELLTMAKDIISLDGVEVIDEVCGVRASSKDYLPIVGKVIDSLKTLQQYPYLKHGSKVPSDRFVTYPNMFILNGVGGRGFVLSPYLANMLVDYIVYKKPIYDKITTTRLFLKNVRL